MRDYPHQAHLNTLQTSWVHKHRITTDTIPQSINLCTTDAHLLVEYSFSKRYSDLHRKDRPEDGANETYALVDLTSRQWNKETVWKVQLFFAGRHQPLECETFTQGAAWISEPSFATVMHCLASDANMACGNTFREWCRDLGYDDDSIKAKASYDACLETMNKFIRIFGIVEAGRLMNLEEDTLFEEFKDTKTYSVHARQRKKAE